MNKKYLPYLLLVIPAIFLTACGAGSTASTMTPVPSTQTPIPVTTTPMPIPFTSTSDIPSRSIGLREFTGNNIISEIPLEFDIPQVYEIINLFDPPYAGNVSPEALSIWLPKENIVGYKSGLPLPADSSFFYIKISDNVTYDDATDTFSGWPLTDQEIIDREAKGTFITFQEQRQIGEFPILIVEESILPDDQGRSRYKYLYIETLAGETIGIIFISSATNIYRDESVWKILIESLSIKK